MPSFSFCLHIEIFLFAHSPPHKPLEIEHHLRAFQNIGRVVWARIYSSPHPGWERGEEYSSAVTLITRGKYRRASHAGPTLARGLVRALGPGWPPRLHGGPSPGTSRKALSLLSPGVPTAFPPLPPSRCVPAEGRSSDLLRCASSGRSSAPRVSEMLPATRKTNAEPRVVEKGRGGILEKALTQHFCPGVGQLIHKVIR